MGTNMHARLTVNQRHKIEKEIATLVASLSEAVSCGDNRISELEKQLEAGKSALADAKVELTRTAQANKDLEARLAAARDELATRDTDLKVQRLEMKNLAGENKDLQKRLSGTDAEIKKLQDQLAAAKADAEAKQRDSESQKRETEELLEIITTFESSDAELRDRIISLEKALVTERQRAGQELMSRILELESMLEVERRRVEDLPEMTTMATIHTSAKAANSVTRTKRKLNKKTG